MAEPDLGPCARTVRSYDPDLFAAALFAREPGRGRLMTLYAYDIELSRAAEAGRGADTGPLIAAMRLQFWRDAVESAGKGGEGPAHEVARPLAGLIAEGWLDAAAALEMAAARDAETEELLDEAAFEAWAEGRFGALVRAAAGVLGGHKATAAAGPAAARAGLALGHAFGLRNAAALALEGRALVPGFGPEDRAALAAGQMEAGLARRLAAAAEAGLVAAGEARRALAEVPPEARPAFLPLWRARRDLALVARRPESVTAGLPPPSGAARSLGLAWSALTGRP